MQAERSRLEGKREQLLRKREAVQAELGRIDCAVDATDDLLQLLAPLLAGNGSDLGRPTTAATWQRSTPHEVRNATKQVSAIAPSRQTSHNVRKERDR